MNNDKPDAGADEKGVSFWAKVPPAVAALTVDFRVALVPAGAGRPMVKDDVAPARPVGKSAGGVSIFANDVAPARPVGHVVVPGAALSANRRRSKKSDDGPAVADLRRGGLQLTLTAPSPRATAGDASYDVEIGPLSYSQGWIEGKAGFKGKHQDDTDEPKGYGKIWRGDQLAILVSLVSPVALAGRKAAAIKPESGVFAWVKLAKPKAGAAAASLAIDLTARFVAKSAGGGTAADPATVKELDVSPTDFPFGTTRKFLAAIDLPEGTWTLYAKGAAVVPENLGYSAAVGPRSQAGSWMRKNGKTWTADAAVYALVTLTTRFDRL